MIETICQDCGQRYQPSTDHVCPAKVTAKNRRAAVKAEPQATPRGLVLDLQRRELKVKLGTVADHGQQETGSGSKVGAPKTSASTSSFGPDSSSQAEVALSPVDKMSHADVEHEDRGSRSTKLGRPKKHPDRAAYRADFMRKKRAEDRAAKLKAQGNKP